MDLLVAVASTTEAGSRSRLEACKVYKRLAKLAGLEGTDQLDAIRTQYEPGQREIPSESELRELLLQLDPAHKYSWSTWALATYGCRPSEVFSLQPSDDGTARVLTVKRKGRAPTWRTAMALPLAEPPGPRSVPLNVTSPGAYDSIEAKRVTGAWGKWLRTMSGGLQLYDIRHAWAIRSIKEAVPTGLASRCMGHDIAVHSRTYHRWLQQADVAAFVELRRGQG
jgi:integrase